MRDDRRGGEEVCAHMLLGRRESPKGIFTRAKSPLCLGMSSKVERTKTETNRGRIEEEASWLSDAGWQKTSQTQGSNEF